MVTTNFHDILHRRLVHPLLIGDVKGCAQKLANCGLTREFFTDQAPVLRAPLHLSDDYKKVEGTHETNLMKELSNLQVTQAQVNKKRKAKDTQGDDGEDDERGNAKDEDDDGGMVKQN